MIFRIEITRDKNGAYHPRIVEIAGSAFIDAPTVFSGTLVGSHDSSLRSKASTFDDDHARWMQNPEYAEGFLMARARFKTAEGDE